jgi:hypothetical protein
VASAATRHQAHLGRAPGSSTAIEPAARVGDWTRPNGCAVPAGVTRAARSRPCRRRSRPVAGPLADARTRRSSGRPDGRSSRSCRDRAAGPAQSPSARPLERSRIVVEGSRGAGQPELMFPCIEFSDVCRCRDGGRVRRVCVDTDRNLPITSRRVTDVVGPSDTARAAGGSIA